MAVQAVRAVHRLTAEQRAQLHLQGKEMQVHFQVLVMVHQAAVVVHQAAAAA
jgi:hypothetical protein